MIAFSRTRACCWICYLKPSKSEYLPAPKEIIEKINNTRTPIHRETIVKQKVMKVEVERAGKKPVAYPIFAIDRNTKLLAAFISEKEIVVLDPAESGVAQDAGAFKTIDATSHSNNYWEVLPKGTKIIITV